MVSLLNLLRSALLKCISDHWTYTQELGVGTGIRLVQWILFEDLLDHLIYFIRSLDLGLTLVDEQWLKPVRIDPGDSTLEPAQLGSFFFLLQDVACAQVWRREHGRVSIRVKHG